MPVASFSRNALFAFTVGLGLVLPTTTALAQAKPPAGETRTGKVVGLRDDKPPVLIVETIEGEKIEVKLTPTLKFSVRAPGDAGFVAPGRYLSGSGTVSQGRIFLAEATIHVSPHGKLPPGKVAKGSSGAGGIESYQVSGPIVSLKPAEGSPEYTVVVLRVAGKAPPIWLQKNYKVWVSTSEPAYASPGSIVELQGKPIRGGKFLATAVEVIRDEALKAADVLPEDKSP